MSEEKKILAIDPNMFSFSKTNTTRKREKKAKPEKALKIRSTEPKKKTDTLKKKSILKMIRQHQEERYKDAFNAKTKNTKQDEPISSMSNEFNKDFKEAQLFLQNLTEKKETEDVIKHSNLNKTLKRYNAAPHNIAQYNSVPIIHGGNNGVSPVPSYSNNISSVNPYLSSPVSRTYLPTYGCLKGGSLPTYRNYMNVTGKNQPPLTIGSNNIKNRQQQQQQQQQQHQYQQQQQQHQQQQQQQQYQQQYQQQQYQQQHQQQHVGGGGTGTVNMHGLMSSIKKETVPSTHAAIVEHAENKINNSMRMVNQINQTAGKLKQTKQKKNKRKKIVRRTFKIGKSKVHPKVAVLVSNKTLRNNITTQYQLLKQTPMVDVKKFLMKRGFIRVGSIAPNDILRKMYEDVTMICGDVQNHNPDNLLYNFLNSNEK